MGGGAASDMAVQTLGRSGFQASGRHSLFFPIASLLLLFLTIAGFWDNLFTDVGQPSNSDPKFIVHGLFCGSWMIALLAQSLLVNRGNVRLHRKLGMFALVAFVEPTQKEQTIRIPARDLLGGGAPALPGQAAPAEAPTSEPVAP